MQFWFTECILLYFIVWESVRCVVYSLFSILETTTNRNTWTSNIYCRWYWNNNTIWTRHWHFSFENLLLFFLFLQFNHVVIIYRFFYYCDIQTDYYSSLYNFSIVSIDYIVCNDIYRGEKNSVFSWLKQKQVAFVVCLKFYLMHNIYKYIMLFVHERK